MLSPREQQILRAVVHEYLASAHPVGSRLLWTRYGLGISPATIRGVMNTLTEAGFLAQPHTSAGRVPTERAYRLFLENTPTAPSLAEQQKLTKRLEQAATAPRASRKLAEQLSELAGAAGIHADREGVSFYNLANLFGQPDLADPRIARYVAELLDQTDEWLPKLANRSGKVVIRIGSEHQDFRARAISAIALKAKIGDYVGHVAVLGPTRLPYRKAAALMEYGARELTRVYG